MLFAKRILNVILIFAVLILIGTLVYHQLEGWRYVDSMYFTVISVTTIGYGDFTPATDFGKIFTVFFSISGIAVAFYTISIMMRYMYRLEYRKKISQKRGIIRTRRKS